MRYFFIAMSPLSQRYFLTGLPNGFLPMALPVASAVLGCVKRRFIGSAFSPLPTSSRICCTKSFSRCDCDTLPVCFWNMSRSLPTSMPPVCMKSLSGSLSAVIRSACPTRYSRTNLLPGVSATPLDVMNISRPPSLSSSMDLTKK